MDPVSPDNQLLHRLIAAAGLRSQVTNANIANANTPGYKRKVVEFEGLLQRELERGGGRSLRVEPTVVEDTLSPARPDGNNVNFELEKAAQNEVRVLMETYLSILQSQFNLLQSAITDGR